MADASPNPTYAVTVTDDGLVLVRDTTGRARRGQRMCLGYLGPDVPSVTSAAAMALAQLVRLDRDDRDQPSPQRRTT